MDKVQQTHMERKVEESSSSQRSETRADETAGETEHIHAKTIILLIAIVGIYWVQVVHATGIGVLANSIVALIGGAEKATWLTKTIAITAASLSPPISQAADFWGRKWFVVGFTVCGAVGSIIASRADGFTQLIIGQAIGSLHAGCQTLIHAIASEIMPRKYRPFAQAATAAAGGLGGVSGALLAGGLNKSDPQNWRIFFYILTALYVVTAAIVVVLYNPPPRELQVQLTQKEKLARLDWFGYFLFIPGIVLFGFALTSSTGVYPWKSPKVIATLVIGAVQLIAFIIYEWKFTSEGMLHHDLFRYGRNFPIAFGAFFVEGIIFFATNAYFSFEAVAIFQRTLFKGGAFYSIGWGVEIVTTFATGFYCAYTKTIRTPLVVAFCSFTIFCSLMASLNPSQTNNMIGYVVFFGIAVGISLNCLVTLAQLSTPKELISITTGLVIGVRSFGGTIGLSVYTAIYNSVRGDEIPKKVAAATSAFDGFDQSNVGRLIGGIATRNTTLLRSIPGATPEMITTASAGYVEGWSLAFRYVWVAAATFCAVCVVACVVIKDPKGEFTEHIDAPIETSEELHRGGIREKIHIGHSHV